MDDYLGGGDSIESVIALVKEIKNVLESAKLHLRKWQSNSQTIINNITNDEKSEQHKTLNLDPSPSKTLGLFWDTFHDTFYFSINHTFTHKYTKRNILSFISQVFDPLGLVGPCILQAKNILQQLWVHKCGWDDEVPSQIVLEFNNFVNSLSHINTIHIPRWIAQDDLREMQLHVFTDASERAYGACVYVRTISIDGLVQVRLLTSKNKVSPIKTITIPRLELCGALLGTRLYKKVIESLTMKFNSCFFWCDSTIVLGWLSTESSSLKQFVRNRVNEILEITKGHTWDYVPSKLNPADLASRGVNADFRLNADVLSHFGGRAQNF
ncbi:unnamed protein product [Parnassius mnemosyne]|uniref:Uncharacterized protein n=1 Tax=Parnassius mnemosyne TaxID=213953 RepID=A0AAV1KG32_9NEOP